MNMIRNQASNGRRKKQQGGFTLLEIMIALAVLGLIAAFAVPAIGPIRKKFAIRGIINDAKTFNGQVVQFVDSYGPPPITEGLVAADVTSYVSGSSFGTSTLPNLNSALRFDQVLNGATIIDKYFKTTLAEALPVPTGLTSKAIAWNPTTKKFVCSPDSTVTTSDSWAGIHRLECSRATGTNPNPSTAAGTNFWLNGDVSRGLDAGTRVVYMVIENISAADAFDLAKHANEEFLDAAVPGTAQTRGRVVYDTPSATTGTTTAYVFIWNG